MNLIIFNYQPEESGAFDRVRTIEDGGKIWFCATDVAKVLGYKNTKDAIIRHCKSDGVVKHDLVVKKGYRADGSLYEQKATLSFISEGNVYRLIVSSKLPSAERFEKWLFDEVVPQIRQKGYYGITDRSVLPEFVKRYKANVHLCLRFLDFRIIFYFLS